MIPNSVHWLCSTGKGNGHFPRTALPTLDFHLRNQQLVEVRHPATTTTLKLYSLCAQCILCNIVDDYENEDDAGHYVYAQTGQTNIYVLDAVTYTFRDSLGLVLGIRWAMDQIFFALTHAVAFSTLWRNITYVWQSQLFMCIVCVRVCCVHPK